MTWVPCYVSALWWTDLVAIFLRCQLQFQVFIGLQLFFKFHLHLGQLIRKHAATILLLLKSSRINLGTHDQQKDAKMKFLTISICLHFLYLSFLSDASLLMPLSFSWMMASSMGSVEPGLPVRTMKARQQVTYIPVYQGQESKIKLIDWLIDFWRKSRKHKATT